MICQAIYPEMQELARSKSVSSGSCERPNPIWFGRLAPTMMQALFSILSYSFRFHMWTLLYALQLVMKHIFVRKLVLHNSRGTMIVNIPKKIQTMWTAEGKTHCRLLWDDEKNTILISPF